MVGISAGGNPILPPILLEHSVELATELSAPFAHLFAVFTHAFSKLLRTFPGELVPFAYRFALGMPHLAHRFACCFPCRPAGFSCSFPSRLGCLALAVTKFPGLFPRFSGALASFSSNVPAPIRVLDVGKGAAESENHQSHYSAQNDLHPASY